MIPWYKQRFEPIRLSPHPAPPASPVAASSVVAAEREGASVGTELSAHSRASESPEAGKTGSPLSQGRAEIESATQANSPRRDQPLSSDAEFTAPAGTEPPVLTAVLRQIANLLRLPHLCGHAKCRRAGRCRGEPRVCLARYAPLVPEEAREGAKAILDAQSRGLDFDTAHEEFAEIDDLLEWQELVESCAARGQ